MRCAMLVLFGAYAGLSVGCNPVGMAAKAGVSMVRGVQADVHPVRDVSRHALASYDRLKVGQVTSDVGRICSPPLITEVRKAMILALADESRTRFTGSGKALVVNVVCRFYKQKSLIGQEGRLDLLAILVDQESGQEVGRLYLEGLTESPVHTGMDDMAKGVSRKLAEYLGEKKKG